MIALSLLAALAYAGPGATPPGPHPAPPRRAVETGGPTAGEATRDDACREALDVAYDGSIDAAVLRLDALVAAQPDHVLCAYARALALVWRVEQLPRGDALERDFQGRVERVLALADARLRADPADVRARFARGALHGLRSRLHMRRYERGDAARAAVRMREDLLQVPAQDPLAPEARFGLGLYDYYADVLPRLLKLLRFLARLPGGDRERGLESIEAAESQALWHRTEARAQLLDIYAAYEDRPDDALALARGLRARYPGAPLWGLKLADHLREGLGLYAESAAVAREVLAAAESGRPNYAPIVGLMARVALGEALLGGLHPAEARRATLPARDGSALAAWIAPRARLVLGRSLELEGDREGAEVHYRLAAASREREWRERAQRALDEPLPSEAARALHALSEARRLRAAGHEREAGDAFRAALRVWKGSQEALLGSAESALLEGRADEARALLDKVDPGGRLQAPWVRPWHRLLTARLLDLAGQRTAALKLYNDVYQHPYGSETLRDLAAAGRQKPFAGRASPPDGPGTQDHSR